MSEVPRTPVTVLIGIDRAGESNVCLPSAARGRRTVDRRSHERMTEPDLAGDTDQPVFLSWAGILIEADSERVSSAPENGHVTGRNCCDQQQHLLRRHRERPRAAQEAFLDPARKSFRIWKLEIACELARTQAVRQFEQRQWIAVRLGDNPVSHGRVEAAGDNGGEQVAGVGLGKAFDYNSRNPGERVQGGAG